MIVALFLISTDWRAKDESVLIPEIVRPVTLYPQPAPVRTTTYSLVPQVPVEQVKRRKPPMAGRDLAGKRLALSQFDGKPVFVIVWASWRVGALEQA